MANPQHFQEPISASLASGSTLSLGYISTNRDTIRLPSGASYNQISLDMKEGSIFTNTRTANP